MMSKRNGDFVCASHLFHNPTAADCRIITSYSYTPLLPSPTYTPSTFLNGFLAALRSALTMPRLLRLAAGVAL